MKSTLGRKKSNFKGFGIGKHFGELEEYKKGQSGWLDHSEEWEEWDVPGLERQTRIGYKRPFRQGKMFAINSKCKGKPLVSFEGLKIISFYFIYIIESLLEMPYGE